MPTVSATSPLPTTWQTQIAAAHHLAAEASSGHCTLASARAKAAQAVLSATCRAERLVANALLAQIVVRMAGRAVDTECVDCHHDEHLGPCQWTVTEGWNGPAPCDCDAVEAAEPSDSAFGYTWGEDRPLTGERRLWARY